MKKYISTQHLKRGPGAPRGNCNAAIDPFTRRTIKKMVTFSPIEWDLVQAMMKNTGYARLTMFIRDRLLK